MAIAYIGCNDGRQAQIISQVDSTVAAIESCKLVYRKLNERLREIGAVMESRRKAIARIYRSSTIEASDNGKYSRLS